MNQLQLNKEIQRFISQKEADNEVYSKKDLEYLQKYTGAGGLAKAGATGRGLLYEFYTPHDLIQKMWGLAFKHGFSSGRILEPSCGIGRFFHYINPELNTVDAYEFAKDNDTSFRIAKACFPWVNITNNYFESIFYEGNKRIGRPKNVSYDLVIGNPPYSEFTGFYAGKQREGSVFKGKTYDQYFIWAGLQLLKYEGLLVYIIPSSFLQNGNKYNDFKQEIAKYSRLVEAYRLPRGVFQMTSLQTDIVVFQKTV